MKKKAFVVQYYKEFRNKIKNVIVVKKIRRVKLINR